MPHILIIEGRFYDAISAMLLEGAVAELNARGASYEQITVPGAFEIPGVIAYALSAASPKFDGYVALGCVIRGETTHYDYVCSESARGLSELSITRNAAIGYGILTVENMEQAVERAAITQGNKGKAAVDACLQMIAIRTELA